MEYFSGFPAPVRALLMPVLPVLELFVIWESLSGTTRWGISVSLVLFIWGFMQANLKPGRMVMRFLLRNRGWLYRDSGQSGGPKTSTSLQIRQHIYLISLWLLWKTIGWEKRLLSGGWKRSKTYAVQDTLPPLPVPKLRDTFRRYLDSVRPIWPSDKCEEMVQLITELGAAGGAGERLQRELVRRARHLRMQSSWIEAWWEKEHLLKSRLPLPVFGNWYGLDRPDTPCMSQSLRAAWLSLGAVRFHRHLSREKLEPLRMMSVVPLCMNQYKGVFNTCRIPCKNVDELHTWDCPSPFGPSTVPQIPQLRRSSPTESPLTPRGTPGGTFLRGGEKVPHLAVMSRGQLYTMDLFHADGISLTVEEIQQQLETILEMSKRAQAGHDAQAPIGILTTEERDTWARLRGKLIEAHQDNQQALHAVESAMFLLVLEGACPEAIEDQAKTMFLGDGRNRWYDKSFQLIVFENACAGVNVEGSWADAPVASHLFGFMHDHENMARFANRSSPNLNPATAGAGADKLSPRLAPPKKLTWRLTSELAEGMDRAQIHFDALADRTDLHVMHMRYFGKGFIKKCQMSPDAFVQMALQLAYYRTTGQIHLMVETAHTRQFLHGRTELVRSVSSDSVAFIKAMAHLDTGAADTKLHLLRRACITHVERVTEAMNGHGVDAHLFGLLVMSRTLGDDKVTKTLEKGMRDTEMMLLSSHAPAQRGPSGGFGTSQEGGYAVSYLINEDNIYLHVCYRKKEGHDWAKVSSDSVDGSTKPPTHPHRG
eukprot:CAMPEP_0179409452 /NCGR_PEP_ID=MMETSP0799-20121207/2710_1 /TAXON_ID=46947 /ORGANISM="Geminigera cryophila, Strain CCMP2564" /LENGTH=765 /DNA_ID=CAMNT_0021181133 /DNA_START=101 /DNA_END=2395 /DNA_ORIENTATION=+